MKTKIKMKINIKSKKSDWESKKYPDCVSLWLECLVWTVVLRTSSRIKTNSLLSENMLGCFFNKPSCTGSFSKSNSMWLVLECFLEKITSCAGLREFRLEAHFHW